MTAASSPAERAATAQWPPGPWRFDENMELWDATDNFILEILVFTPEEVGSANAAGRLISAAPELYEALKAAEEELRLIRMKDHGTVYNPGLSVQITLALQKAEGR